jgi:hypothetical protein
VGREQSNNLYSEEAIEQLRRQFGPWLLPESRFRGGRDKFFQEREKTGAASTISLKRGFGFCDQPGCGR